MRHRFQSARYGLFLFLFMLLSGGSSIFADKIIHTPQVFFEKGRQQEVFAYFSKFNEISFAFLYLRIKGTLSYVRLNMQGSGSTFRAQIPDNMLDVRGLEYYLEFTSNKNVTYYFPESNYQAKPIFVRVTEARPAEPIEVFSPQNDASLLPEELEIRFTIGTKGADPNSLRIKVMLNQFDISVMCRPKDKQYQCLLPKEYLPKPGNYELYIQAVNLFSAEIQQRKIPFRIVASAAEKGEEIKWKQEGTLSTTYQFSHMKINQETVNPVSDPHGYGNVSLGYKAEYNDFFFNLGPVSLTTQQRSNQQNIQSFSFNGGNRYFTSSWGTVSLALPGMLQGGGFLGGAIELHNPQDKEDESKSSDSPVKKEKFEYKVKAGGGQSKQAIESEIAPAGIGTFAQRVYGVGIELKTGKLQIGTGIIDTRDNKNSITDAGAALAASNQVLGLNFTYQLGYIVDSFSLEAGYSFVSRGNEDFTDNSQGFSGRGSINFEKIPLFDMTLSANFQEARKGFFHLLNGSQGDNRSAGASLSYRIIEPLSFSNSYNFSIDNLDGTKELTTKNHALSGSMSVNFADMPQLSFNVSQNFQFAQGNPLADSENSGLSAGVSLSYRVPLANPINLGGNFQYSDNQSKTAENNNRSMNRNFGANASYTPFPWIDLAVQGSLNQTLNAPFSDTSALSLNLVPHLPGDKITMPLSVSYNKSLSQDDPQTTNNDLYAITLGVGYMFTKEIKLDLAAGFNLYQDNINSDSNYQQFTIMVNFNMSF